MMDVLRMFFLRATFKQKEYAVKNVEDYSSKEQDLNTCPGYLRIYFLSLYQTMCRCSF